MSIKCFATTNSFGVSPQGELTPCCKYRGSFGPINEVEDFLEINKTKGFLDLKDSHSQGLFTKGCKRCESDEEENITSRRNQLEEHFSGPGMNADQDYYIDLNVGNYCNLKCRMCNSDSSSLWIKDREELLEMGLNLNVASKVQKYIITEEDLAKIIKKIENISGNIHLEIKGGEPLILKAIDSLFEKLSSLKNAHKISISLVTNGSRIPQWLKSVSQNFQYVDLYMSVDGKDGLFEYIRGGQVFSWNQAQKNIEELSTLRGVNLKFGVVVQNYNILQLKNIIDELLPYVNNINEISFMTLRNPDFLQAYVVPRHLKDQIGSDLSTYKESKKIQDLLRFIDKDPSVDQKEKFYKYTSALDKIRGESLGDVVPELTNPEAW